MSEELEFSCPQCGRALVARRSFCPYCGYALATHRDAPSAPRPLPEAEKRPRRTLTCALVLALFIVVCGGATAGLYFWLGLHRADHAAQVAPADHTIALASFSPSLLQAPRLLRADDWRVSSLPLAALPGVAEATQVIQADDWPELQIDPRRDILPWIGREVSLIVLQQNGEPPAASDRPPGRARQGPNGYSGPPLVLTAVTRNRAASDTFLAGLQEQMEQQGIQFAESTYRDTLIVEANSLPGFPLVYTTSDDLVVVATDVKALHQILDAAADEATPVLVNQASFHRSLAELPANRLGYIYLDWAEVVASADLPPEMATFSAIQSVAIAPALTGQGARFDFAIQYDPAALSLDQQVWLRLPPAEGPELSSQTPASALAYLAGQDPWLIWESWGSDLWPGLLDLIGQPAGASVVRDFLNLTDGTFAVAAMHEPEGLPGYPDVPLALVTLAKIEDPSRTRSDLEEIAGPLAQSAGFDLVEDELNRVPVWWLEGRNRDITLGYGFVEDVFVAGSSPDALRLTLRARQASLAGQERFQAAVAPLPEETLLFAYVDAQRGLRTFSTALAQAGAENFVQLIQSNFSSVQAVSLALQPLDEHALQYGVLYVLTQ